MLLGFSVSLLLLVPAAFGRKNKGCIFAGSGQEAGITCVLGVGSDRHTLATKTRLLHTAATNMSESGKTLPQ